MDSLFNQEEKELIRLIQFFRKRGEIYIIENKLGEEHAQLLEVCDKLLSQMERHANVRKKILDDREKLAGMVKDNALCPYCESAAMLKVIGAEKNEKGWASNKYKCRKCNITFVWNTPNNPWDMIPYVENFITQMESKLESLPDMQEKSQTLATLGVMRESLAKLKPAVETSDELYNELQECEKEMARMVRDYRKQLMIEKIRLEE